MATYSGLCPPNHKSTKEQQGHAMMVPFVKFGYELQTVSTLGIVSTAIITYTTVMHLLKRHGRQHVGHFVCWPFT